MKSLTVTLAISFLLIILSSCISSTPTTQPTYTPAQKAWYVCLSFIEKQHGLAEADAQQFLPDNVKELTDRQYEVGIFYVSKVSRYTCIVTDLGSQWRLDDLSVDKGNLEIEVPE